jgi:hypothetical protein
VQDFDTLLPFIPLAFIAYFAWRYFKHGSLTGAFLGGRISRSVGEVKVSTSSFSSSVLRVGVLETDPMNPPQVALTIVSKAVFGASMVPYKLSADQARQLAALLHQAAER